MFGPTLRGGPSVEHPGADEARWAFDRGCCSGCAAAGAGPASLPGATAGTLTPKPRAWPPDDMPDIGRSFRPSPSPQTTSSSTAWVPLSTTMRGRVLDGRAWPQAGVYARIWRDQRLYMSGAQVVGAGGRMRG